MGRAAVIHLGCKVNRVESDGYERLLAQRGFGPAAAEDADIVIVNTCTVTAAADKKARKAVNGALRANPSAPIIVTGCGAAVNPDQFERLSPRVTVVPRAALAEYLSHWMAAIAPSDDGCAPAPLDGRARPSVKVQDGCDNRCTYCIVPAARGRAVSIGRDEVLRDVDQWLDRGAREIVLSGINLGAYDDGVPLAGLLAEILARMPENARVRLSSIEPDFVTEELIELLASNDGRVCRHLHLPLQAGSDRVLAAMGRHYDAAFYLDLVKRLREAMPMIALATDLIVGFPGETDTDFDETLALARACAFSRIHAFSFSARPGTPAATFANPVAPETIHDRSCRLRSLGAELAAADLRRRADTRERVLVEAPGQWRTESYHLLEGDPSLVNAEVGALTDLVIDLVRVRPLLQ